MSATSTKTIGSFGQRGMEEGVAAQVAGETALKVVPPVDLVHGLRGDEAFEYRRR